MKKAEIPNPEFPSDIWPEILSYLPVKSLLRFRCVSRSWLALIDDPDFARSHLTRFSNNRHETHFLAVYRHNYNTMQCVLRSSETLEITSRLAVLSTCVPSIRAGPTTVPTFDDVEGWDVVSAADGLVMLQSTSVFVDAHVHFMLWNPSIRKFRKVPSLPEFVITDDMDMLDWCLGFDSASNDYKYVRVIQTDSFKFIAVYSAATNSWKKIEIQGGEGNPQWRRYFNYYVQGICFNGVLYTTSLLDDDAIELVFFDLSSETLDSVVLPEGFKNKELNTSQTLTVANGGSSLAMVKFTSTSGSGSIWVCESTEGDDKLLIWTQQHTFACKIPEFCRLGGREPYVLYLMKNGEMLIDWSSMVSSYNLETQEEKILLQNYLHHGPLWPYAESLMLLN